MTAGYICVSRLCSQILRDSVYGLNEAISSHIDTKRTVNQVSIQLNLGKPFSCVQSLMIHYHKLITTFICATINNVFIVFLFVVILLFPSNTATSAVRPTICS